MSSSKTKLLISGCGITYSQQDVKTWGNILKSIGVDVVDVAGPAVSNQWIINRAFLQLHRDPTIKRAVIQLTSLGKLDVVVDQERFDTLVAPDSKRNFIIDNVWPSSASVEHESKALWRKWLASPALERQDIKVKLLMLQDYCNTHDISCVIVQGYNLGWVSGDRQELSNVISDIDSSIIADYAKSEYFDVAQEIPALSYQFHLAEVFCKALLPEYLERLDRMRQQYIKSKT